MRVMVTKWCVIMTGKSFRLVSHHSSMPTLAISQASSLQYTSRSRGLHTSSHCGCGYELLGLSNPAKQAG